MHYRNGRAALEGDPAIGESWKGSRKIVAGTLFNLQPGLESCNAALAVPRVGGCETHCVTVGDLVHAEDGFEAVPAAAPVADEQPTAGDAGQG